MRKTRTDRRTWAALALALGGLWLLAAGCPAGDDDDNSAAVDDDDDTTTADPFAQASPASGSPLAWHDCLTVSLQADVDQPTVVAQAGDGTPLPVFLVDDGDRLHLSPMEPWPAGGVIQLTVGWDGGSTELAYPIDALGAPVGDPTGKGAAYRLNGGHSCPDPWPMIDDITGSTPLALFQVVTAADTTAVVRLSATSSGGDAGQDPCVVTGDHSARYLDPLLHVDSAGPIHLLGGLATESSWLAAELDAGSTPVAVAQGLLFLASSLDALVEDDACVLLADLGAPWCGPCPHRAGETCAYVYLREIDTAPLEGDLVERTWVDVADDPGCDE